MKQNPLGGFVLLCVHTFWGEERDSESIFLKKKTVTHFPLKKGEDKRLKMLELFDLHRG